MVTDLCTDCGEGDLALSEFSLFGGGPKDEGRVPVQWQAVPCNPPSWQTMGFVLRDSSTWEVSVALRRARYPVVGLEFWVDKNGRWTGDHRPAARGLHPEPRERPPAARDRPMWRGSGRPDSRADAGAHSSSDVCNPRSDAISDAVSDAFPRALRCRRMA